MRLVLLQDVLWLCAFALGPAQTTPQPSVEAKPAPEMVSHDAAPTFSSKVNLVLVPVVVRDRNGKAIGNLTKDDFRLFDKGKPQVISRFSVESPSHPPAATSSNDGGNTPSAVDPASDGE